MIVGLIANDAIIFIDVPSQRLSGVNPGRGNERVASGSGQDAQQQDSVTHRHPLAQSQIGPGAQPQQPP